MPIAGTHDSSEEAGELVAVDRPQKLLECRDPAPPRPDLEDLDAPAADADPDVQLRPDRRLRPALRQAVSENGRSSGLFMTGKFTLPNSEIHEWRTVPKLREWIQITLPGAIRSMFRPDGSQKLTSLSGLRAFRNSYLSKSVFPM